jgi:anti-sigma factor ChrR (cupin superfamily)
MNCDECLEWIKTHAGRGVPENPEVSVHLQSCPACSRVFALDACLEAGIQQAFTPHRLPAGLLETIDACVDRYAGVGRKPEPPGRDPVNSVKTIVPVPGKHTSENRGR